MRVLVTGSGGVIGIVLQERLPYEFTEFDLPDHTVLDLHDVSSAAANHDAIIHLAWDKRGDDWLSENLNTDNIQGAFHVLEAANQAGVKRVIIASSVHADDFVGEHIVAPLRPYDLPTPDSPYGANKCMIEALGRYYAHAKDLEVICIRFGGVNRDDQPPASPPSERQVWFSQQDCASLIASCLQAENIPNGFAIVYGISANDGLVQDLSNPFGWEPNDGST